MSISRPVLSILCDVFILILFQICLILFCTLALGYVGLVKVPVSTLSHGMSCQLPCVRLRVIVFVYFICGK